MSPFGQLDNLRVKEPHDGLTDNCNPWTLGHLPEAGDAWPDARGSLRTKVPGQHVQGRCTTHRPKDITLESIDARARAWSVRFEVWTQWTWEYPRMNGKNGDRVNQLCGLTMAPNKIIIGLRCLSHCPSPQKSFNGLPRQPSGDPTASARRPSAGRLVGSPDMPWLGATFWFVDLQVEKQLVRVNEDVTRCHESSYVDERWREREGR